MELNTTTIVVIAIFILIVLMFRYVPIGLWNTARLSGVKIKLSSLVLMQIKHVIPAIIVRSKIMANSEDIDVSIDELQALFLAGGDVEKIISSMIIAKKNGMKLSLKEAFQQEFSNKV